MKLFLTSIFLTTLASITMAQSIEDHQWENRILILSAKDANNAELLMQLQEFRANETGLKDRKLLIYQLVGEQYKIGLADDNDWKEIPNDLWARAQKTKNEFQVILIGLDGGEKYKTSAFLPCEDLFAIIDAMPMRKAEIRNKRSID